MICPHCSKEHPSHARYCPETGKVIALPTGSNAHSAGVAGSLVGVVSVIALLLIAASVRGDEVIHEERFSSIASSASSGSTGNFGNTSGSGNTNWSTYGNSTGLNSGDYASGVGGAAILLNSSPQETGVIVLVATPRVPPSQKPLSTTVPTHTRTATCTATPTPTLTSAPTLTATRTATPTLVPTATSTSTPNATNVSDSADLILIPAGEFNMGSNPENDPYFWGAEMPMHPVFLDSYYIYRTEVTNAMYAQCVADHKCPLPAQLYSRTRAEYYGESRFADYPVIFVTYYSATAYCQWAGGRLPTEAEWEKAARGSDNRWFPWGDDLPTITLANFDNQIGDTSPVGSYPLGVSPYGLLDMAGNVWEWTFDWFDATFYRISPDENPLGPVNGTRRVMRGGSWSNLFDGMRTMSRTSSPPNQSLDALGFRCVSDVAP